MMLTFFINHSFIIHQLREQYLVDIHDGIGESVIALDPPLYKSSIYKSGLWSPDLLRRSHSPPISLPQVISTTKQQNYFHSNGGSATPVLSESLKAGGGLTTPIAAASGRGGQTEESMTTGPADSPNALKNSRRSSNRDQGSLVSKDFNSQTNSLFLKYEAGFSSGEEEEELIRAERERRDQRMGRLASTRDTYAHTIGPHSSSATTDGISSFKRGNLPINFTMDSRRFGSSSSSLSFSKAGIMSLNTYGSEEDVNNWLKNPNGVVESENSNNDANALTFTPKLLGVSPELMMSTDITPLSPLTVFRSLPKGKSALSTLISNSRKKAKNELEQKFAEFSGQGDPKALHLHMYRPTSKTPQEPFQVILRNDAKVFEAIGFSLYRYIEEGLEPPLTPAEQNVNKWTLRIMDDGEVDEDFSALDRNRSISKFTFDEFALVEASESQFLEYEASPTTSKFLHKAESRAITISAQDSPSRKSNTIATNGDLVNKARPGVPTTKSNTQSGASVVLRIHRPANVSSNLPLSQILYTTKDTYLAEVLSDICKFYKLDPKNYCLKLFSYDTIAPLDRTVTALQERNVLRLVPKSELARSDIDRIGESLSPNGK